MIYQDLDLFEVWKILESKDNSLIKAELTFQKGSKKLYCAVTAEYGDDDDAKHLL